MADDVVRRVVSFAHALRAAGAAVGPERASLAVAGLDRVELDQPGAVYWTLRQTLVSRHDDLALFDAAFRGWSLGAVESPEPAVGALEAGGSDGGDAEGEAALGWTATETLRTKDFARAGADELQALDALVVRIASARPRRRSHRLEPERSGRRPDLRRTVRSSLARGGEPLVLTHRRRMEVPRRIVFLCDVSGSMAPYARPLLLFAHGVGRAGRGSEVFAFGTRLTRLTAHLALREPGRALAAAADAVADWDGGTRIGASLKAFNDAWGRRGVARGAVVVVASDGLERDDAEAVGHEMERLARWAHAVVWVNPLKGDPAYEPLAGGMRAALPHVDRFLPGHDLASLEALADVLAGIGRRHAA